MKGNLYAIPTNPEIVSAIAQPMYERTPHPQHITLAYNIDEHSVHADSTGIVFSAPVVSQCWNDRTQCLKVILPTGIPWAWGQEKTPHITLSWPQGSAPVQSSLMLASSGYSETVFPEPIFVVFRVEFVPYVEKEPQF
jgi:hypothetical protein